MKSYTAALLTLVFLGSEISVAKFNRSRAVAAGNSMGSNISTNAQRGSAVQQTENTSVQEASVDNMQNGQKGQSTAFILSAALGVAAAVKFGQCSSSNPGACVMGAILMGMSMQANKSGKSFSAPISDSWNNICTYSTNGCNGPMPNPYAPIVTDGASDEAISRARRLAESRGIKVDPNSGVVKTADGKEIDSNDPGSMASALGGDGYGELMAEVKSLEAEAMKKVEQIKVSSDSYGVGGKGTEISLGEGGYDEGGAGLTGAAAAAARARKPAQVSGLTKKFNGDPIGVAGDSIFLMMSRRYKLKSSQKTFLGADLQ